jgi:hypothetical protein
VPGTSDGSVAWGDYDNDGRLDFLLTTLGGSQLWRNTESGFTNVTASVAPGLPPLTDSAVAWGDYDNDGRLDQSTKNPVEAEPATAIKQSGNPAAAQVEEHQHDESADAADDTPAPFDFNDFSVAGTIPALVGRGASQIR